MLKREEKFIAIVHDHYKRHGRRGLPWRKTKDPYYILVSEIMLQQTQVDRVLPKYEVFLKRFGTVATLAKAPLGAVLGEWQGLGYNRRAKMLHESARRIIHDYGGVFPQDYNLLKGLPGIGPYTAGAIMAFAFNAPVPIIETNIRSVYLHHFYVDATEVSDRELLELVVRTLDTKNPRRWYAALMDYGSHIKKTYGNPNKKSKHYTRQSAFKGSDREIRGAILRHLVETSATRVQLLKSLPFEGIRIDAQLEKLVGENLIEKKRTKYGLPK